jgi:fumarate reductase flavoprotein subunit
MNEDGIANTTYTGNAIATQPKRCAYSIMDQGLLDYYKQHGPDIKTHVHPLDIYDRFDQELERALDAGYEHIFVADTLEALAEKAGIDSDGLVETVDEYNAFCGKGHDDLFEKEHRYLYPIKQGKFYAIRFFPGAYGTLGGIKINHKTEAVTADDETIPGLYAVGTDACNIYGDSYPFILGGNTMAFALNSGRIAGENATRYVNALV